jgi:FMN reductase
VLLIATPIYQAGMPGVLKNVFDLLPSDALEHTVTALIVTAGSMRHFMVPETQMRPILTYLKAQVLQQYVFVEERDFQGSAIANEDVFFRLQRLITEAFLQAEVQTMLREREENAFGF